ncbi:MAG: lysoplasmalogenase [Candidatus Heimdallarchaeota archaeon]|nr:MAG: lysoplasmalogenase [Candidatus Heimdallarchaeota archaeon]
MSIYLPIYCAFAISYIFLKSVKTGELQLENSIIQNLTQISSIIKGIPAVFLVILVILLRPINALFYFVLAGAFVFCFLGDLGMERGLIPGLPLFLIAQILFSVAFLGQTLTLGVTVESLFLPGLVTLVMIIYIFLFLRYLESSETGLGKFRIPVLIYCVFISLMFISSVLLLSVSGIIEFGLVALGGLFFVISDSIIAVREFHHVISYRELKVMSTYYAAILFLSLAVFMV